MRILMLGGTEFVGRAVTEAALAREWEVTVFHRGRHEPPPGVRALHGDRTQTDGMAALAQGEWDLAVDTWSGPPRVVRDTLRLLDGRIGHYTYVSSRGIYDFPVPAPLTEERPVVAGSPDDGEVTYREAKAGGEVAAEQAMGERSLRLRPGLIFGPRENSGRVPWWLRRAARGGPQLAPGPRTASLQYIDVRDLATWTLDAAGRGLHGVYNLVCPPEHATMEDFLTACAEVTGAGAELRWIDPEQILAAGIRPWTGLPGWLPPGEMHELLHRTDVSKAVAAGLRCRPVKETVADTWEWLREVGGDTPEESSQGGYRTAHELAPLDPDVEARLLKG
ncbi:reductase [[Actinomadura] parvosata subsp. kistnae]|uniref:Reductase n=1 Tax=[Actinomadura] parvosata subsp. kistnae TaxID=1909395 RepID=A0A1V0A123_9ACTN|nr:NAD-dependent epimerase/dehydratase family protein [Nonomuraea sp. ATCC 55076]AQZ63904.1 reductase [Nonomuraea sp. ATCC 55076]